MITPELGTEPRPDTTGPTKYDAVASHEFNGMSKAYPAAPVLFSVPWGAFWIRFDFPETKFAPLSYEVEVSTEADFEDGIPDIEKMHTGISGSPPLGDFNQIVLSLNPYGGVSQAMQPNTQYYARVRAVMAAGPGVWSEPMGGATKPLPNGHIDGPVATITATAVASGITYTIVAAPNPVSLSPVYDQRAVAKGPAGHTVVAAELTGFLATSGPGEYTVYGVVTDEAGRSTRCSTKVMVPAV